MLPIVADILRRRRTQGWLVGGSVRDRELGRFSPDLDIVVADDAGGVAKALARELQAPWFALSERHGAYRVMGEDGRIDVAALRGDDIRADLGERDFTVNAMALPVDGRGLIDPFDGLSDLREGRLVAVSERIFVDDPLRLMRAARFCHVLGLRPDAALVWALHDQAPLLLKTAPERVAAEMALTLSEGRVADALRLWSDLGLLSVTMPELSTAERLVPTITLLERLDDLLARPATWFPAAAELLSERLARPVDGAVTRPVALRLGGLMHRFSGDEVRGAATRLRLSSDLGSLLRTIARHGTSGKAQGTRAGLPTNPAGRPAVLFLWDTAPWEPEVICLLAAAGRETSQEEYEPGSDTVLGRARSLMALWSERTLRGVPRPPVDGEILMSELGLSSGPRLGRVLREVRLAWESGEVDTYDGVLAVARAAAQAELPEAP